MARASKGGSSGGRRRNGIKRLKDIVEGVIGKDCSSQQAAFLSGVVEQFVRELIDRLVDVTEETGSNEMTLCHLQILCDVDEDLNQIVNRFND